MVGLDAELNNGSAHFVHHLVIKGFTNSDDCGGVCSELFFGQEDVEVNETDCSDFTYQDWYGWAPGVAPLAMPDDVGFLFGPNGYRSVGEYDSKSVLCMRFCSLGGGGHALVTVNRVAQVAFLQPMHPLNDRNMGDWLYVARSRLHPCEVFS